MPHGHVGSYFPDQGWNPILPLEAQSLDHWTTRQAPKTSFQRPLDAAWPWFVLLTHTQNFLFNTDSLCFYWFWSDPNWQGDLQDLFHSSEFYVTAKIIIVFHFPSPSHWQISRIGRDECSLPPWELSSNEIESRSVNTSCGALSPWGPAPGHPTVLYPCF